MGLFKKKVGGSFLGNMLRNVGDTFTGGMVSKLLPKPTAEDVRLQEAKWAAKGKAFEADPLANSVLGGQAVTSTGRLMEVDPIADSPTAAPTKTKLPWKWIGIIGGGVVTVVTVIIVAVKSGKNKGGRGRR